MERVTGILSPVASLPSRHGIGDFGKESYRFAELSAKAGFRLWQVLPLNPLGYGHSPYQPFSSYAIDELYADLDALKEEGLIKGDIPDFARDSGKILYEEIRDFKLPYLQEAFSSFMRKRGAARKLEDFRKEEMRRVYQGIYVKDIVLFADDELNYIIYDSSVSEDPVEKGMISGKQGSGTRSESRVSKLDEISSLRGDNGKIKELREDMLSYALKNGMNEELFKINEYDILQ